MRDNKKNRTPRNYDRTKARVNRTVDANATVTLVETDMIPITKLSQTYTMQDGSNNSTNPPPAPVNTTDPVNGNPEDPSNN